LFPSTTVALLDAAPLLGLSPLFTCYWLALIAAVQAPRRDSHAASNASDTRPEKKPSKPSHVLQGVKPLKALCAVFVRVSSWYNALARPPQRGPWSYDWAPPMPQLRRELSACIIIVLCLDDAERLPKAADFTRAVQRAELLQASAAWQQLELDLRRSHAQLDAAPTAEHVAVLAQILTRAAITVKSLPALV
jgi:hypothetical protein